MKFVLNMLDMFSKSFIGYSQIFAFLAVITGQGKAVAQQLWAVLNTEKYLSVAEPFKRALLHLIAAINELKLGWKLGQDALQKNPEDFKFLTDFVKASATEYASAIEKIGLSMSEADMSGLDNVTLPKFLTQSDEYKTLMTGDKEVIDLVALIDILTVEVTDDRDIVTEENTGIEEYRAELAKSHNGLSDEEILQLSGETQSVPTVEELLRAKIEGVNEALFFKGFHSINSKKVYWGAPLPVVK